MAIMPPDPLYAFRQNADHGAITCICMHRSERLISGTAAGSIHLFDLQSNRTLLNFRLPGAATGLKPSALLALQKHDETLYTQQRDGCVAEWQLSNAGYAPAEPAILTGHSGFCRMELVPSRGWLLAPHGDDGAISVWDTRKPGLRVVLLRPPTQVAELATGPSDEADDIYQSRKTPSGTTPTSTTSPSAPAPAPTPAPTPTSLGQLMCIKYICISTTADYILGCYESGDFVTWDMRCAGYATGVSPKVHVMSFGAMVDHQRITSECPMTLDYDANSNRGVFGTPSSRLAVFGYNRGLMRVQMRSEIELKQKGVSCVRIRPDKKVFSVGGWDGRVKVYSWGTLRQLAVLQEHKEPVADIVYSADRVSLWNAPVMAVAGQDGHISLWDLYN